MKTPVWGIVLIVFALAASSCGSVGAAANSPSVELGVCVLEHMAVDLASGMTWAQAIEDTARSCGTDARGVTRLMAAQERAAVTLMLADAGPR